MNLKPLHISTFYEFHNKCNDIMQKLGNFYNNNIDTLEIIGIIRQAKLKIP